MIIYSWSHKSPDRLLVYPRDVCLSDGLSPLGNDSIIIIRAGRARVSSKVINHRWTDLSSSLPFLLWTPPTHVIRLSQIGTARDGPDNTTDGGQPESCYRGARTHTRTRSPLICSRIRSEHSRLSELSMNAEGNALPASLTALETFSLALLFPQATNSTFRAAATERMLMKVNYQRHGN